MKNLITKIATAALLIGSLTACNPRASENKAPQSYKEEPEKITRNEKLNRISWGVVDTNVDGKFDELITPHRNRSYGTNTPVYVRGGKELAGEVALDFANEVVRYKNDFAKMAGIDKTIYWLCRVDDFNGDGEADRISWPRMGDKMFVFEKPLFPKGIQEKADKVVLMENYIMDYVERNKFKH